MPCARLASPHRTEEDLVALYETIEREKIATVTDAGVPHLSAEFHGVVAQATQNRVLVVFVSALHRVAHPPAFVDTDAEVGKQAVRHRIALHAAIKDRDAGTATTVMKQHLDYSTITPAEAASTDLRLS
ncbi:FadR/GntR family transcriptional regulator [Streptomyces sp. NPDC004561]